ncbi:MAG: formate/nitrite transporter family protein [Alphaproteobacteria bacterium]
MNEESIKPKHVVDLYAPAKIAVLVKNIGVRKARTSFAPALMLGILAGAFIAIGAMLYTMTVTGVEWGIGANRLLGGLVFSLGLVLVIIGGAELFTGNCLFVMAWTDRKVSTGLLIRNWGIVYFGNFVNAAGATALVHGSGTLGLGESAVQATAAAIARGKLSLPFMEVFVRGILCNILVCLAVCLSYAAHHVAGKFLVIILPVAAFVALGFEHSVSNMYFIPVAMFASVEGVTMSGFFASLIPVTLGNIVGGGVFVAFVFWVIYLRLAREKKAV